eukprot:m.88508 g.88508  ORF g.88508 m.88508 type:complete len:839 (+) comp12269_c0_seq1:132-2648(+)
MGTLWRSQPVNRAQLFLQPESAYETISALGEIGQVQFIDSNPDVNAFQRKFVNEVRRCDEMERKLRYFEAEVEKADFKLNGADVALEERAPDLKEMAAMEGNFAKIEREMKEINGNEQVLKKQHLELTELLEILSKTAVFFDEAEAATATMSVTGNEDHTPLLQDNDGVGGQLGFVTGVIVREKVPSFERLLWRACRGNVFLRRVAIEQPIKDPSNGDELHKEVFIVFFQGEQLGKRVKKICEGFEATIYPCPATPSQRRELKIGVDSRLADLHNVLGRTEDHRRQVLQNIAFRLGGWLVHVRKIKAIFHTMNKFNVDATRKCLIAECWYPTAKLAEIQEGLRDGSMRSASDVPSILNDVRTTEQPPTAYFTNKFTSGFQGIVNAYGVASYREVNPGPFTIITFPFLFAVMFGDLGHGFLMAIAAFFIILKEKALSKFDGGEIWKTMYDGRYIILLMGLFSMYTGFIYNDIFSKSVTWAPSGWTTPDANVSIHNDDTLTLAAPYIDHKNMTHNGDFRHPYVLGLDPIWQVADNKLTFSNSYKMKLSVILGIVQMGFGVILSLFNHVFFKKSLKMIHEFIPQILFLGCIFGYLVVMIVYKWVTPLHDFPNKTAPSLLIMLINMFLRFGLPPPPDQVLYGDPSGSTQQVIQMALVVIAVICVPWMLLTRPLILRSRMKKRENEAHNRSADGMLQQGTLAHDDDDDDDEGEGHSGGHDEEHNFGEIMVHQAIHTIEFCLGCISNTASYLRLWALSLAHSQLSDVLWQMVLKNGFPAFWKLFFMFSAWAALTIAVLLIMEGLSAFLHALRLHWVEFQSKFYEGSGHLFAPFKLQSVIVNEEE